MDNFENIIPNSDSNLSQDEQTSAHIVEQGTLNEPIPDAVIVESNNEIISGEHIETVPSEERTVEKGNVTISEAIPERKAATKKKSRIIIPCIAVLGLLIIVGTLLFGISASQKKKSDNIIHALQSNDVKEAFDLYEEAGSSVIKRYGSAIEEAFSEMVFNNKYSFGSASTGLILEERLNDYADYIRFAEKAEYSENNKAVRYLKTAIKLNDYVKYNSIISLFLRIADDYENFLYYVTAAMNATKTSGTTLLTYHNRGKECIASIYNEAKNYSGYLCLDLKSAAHELYMWFDTNGSVVSAEDFIKDRETIANILNETSDAVDEINEIKKALAAY